MNCQLELERSVMTPVLKRSGYILLWLSIVVLSGCTRYQYISVSSKLYQNDRKEFVNENDTVLMLYSFSGQNFPLSVTIYNRLSIPMYIDLQRSTVLINDFNTGTPFDHEGQINMVPPGSYAIIESDPLSDKFITFDPKDSLANKPVSTNLGKNRAYNEETTPVLIRSVIALSVNEDLSHPTFYDYSFWVSDVLQTMTGPEAMGYNPSNQFYISKTTGFGKVMSWTGTIILLILSGLFAGV
jgi:hypothetical protein